MSDTIHLLSATTYTDGTRAAMCGERLTAEAARIHPYANYTRTYSPTWRLVTCEACKTATADNRS